MRHDDSEIRYLLVFYNAEVVSPDTSFSRIRVSSNLHRKTNLLVLFHLILHAINIELKNIYILQKVLNVILFRSRFRVEKVVAD